MKLVRRRFYFSPLEDRALTTSKTTLNNSHETENVTKAVDHKPIDSKTCTELENLYLTIGDILQIPLILTHAQTKGNYTLKKF